MKRKTILIAIVALLVAGSTTAFVIQNKRGNSENSSNTSKSKETEVVHLTTEAFKNKVHNFQENDKWKYKGNEPAIIEFYADWCAPCRQIAPVLDKLSVEYKDEVTIYKINVEKEKKLAQLFRVRGIPTFLFVPENDKPYLKTGFMGESQLKEQIAKISD